MNFEKQEIGLFLDELASDTPAPGGGSVAALGASLGASLVSMVANLTVGREKYKDSWQAMEKVLSESEPMRRKFIKLMNEDTESFKGFMTALKMPKDTDGEKAARQEAMAEASKRTTEVPLSTLELCVFLAEIANEAMKHGNKNAVSDAGVAALFADAAGKAAAFNVKINLQSIKDEKFAAEVRKKMDSALEALASLSESTERGMKDILG